MELNFARSANVPYARMVNKDGYTVSPTVDAVRAGMCRDPFLKT